MIQYTWLLYSLGILVLAGVIPVLFKAGSRKTDACLAVGIVMAAYMVMDWAAVIQKKVSVVQAMKGNGFLYLLLAGAILGIAWICFLKALSCGEICKVMPLIAWSETAWMLPAFFLLKQNYSRENWLCAAAITLGMLLMVAVKPGKNCQWLAYTIVALLCLLVQKWIEQEKMPQVQSDLTQAVYHTLIFVMAWIVVMVMQRQKQFRYITFVNGLLLVLAVLGFYGINDMQEKMLPMDLTGLGEAMIAIWMLPVFACAGAFQGERPKKIALLGLILYLAGTLAYRILL